MYVPSNRLILPLLIGALALLLRVEPGSAQPDSVRIPTGVYHSLFPEVVGEPVTVPSFRLDRHAVSNEQYREFVRENPEWAPGQASSLQAGESYLKQWTGAAETDANRPVSNVSWFAAASYCEWAGGRLPELDEWEYAAQRLDLESDAEWTGLGNDILGWITSVDPTRLLPQGESGIVTLDGVEDLHLQTLEWVADFRPPLSNEITFDCGTAGRVASGGNGYRYASVIRTLTRMNLDARTTSGTVGFRCAYDIPNDQE
ncbi:MAG: formylglycine-generating enzyme family protein [Balneolaceae bacterium]